MALFNSKILDVQEWKLNYAFPFYNIYLHSQDLWILVFNIFKSFLCIYSNRLANKTLVEWTVL
jgi:hypothetical protein